MNANKLFLLSCIVLFSVTSCSNKIIFTQAYRNRVTSKKQLNVERLQYYNDRKIELVYRSSSAHESISGGKVEFKEGYYIYTIEIKKKTPCVVKWYNNNRALKVYFEEGKYLIFRNFKGKKHYQLGGKKRNGVFQVLYENKWFTPEIGSGARLLFIKNKKVEREEDKRRARGMKVN